MKYYRKAYIWLFIPSLFIFSCHQDNKGIHPVSEKMTESVYASGIIKAVDQYTVLPTVNGILQKIHVVAGQEIEQGQLLFELERDKANLDTESARLALQLSQESSRYIQNRIQELELKVQAAQDKLNLDESIYNRNKNILDLGGISEVDFQKFELTYKSSKLNYESSKKQLSQLKDELQNNAKQKNLNLRVSEKSQSDYSIRSTYKGQLFDVLVKEGSLITPQTPMAVIGKTNSFILELQVDENDMVQVALGQEVLITMDSYREVVFNAVVEKIHPIMDERSRTFKIEASFINPPETLYPNLTAEANIIINVKEDALIIPRAYLLSGDSVLIGKNKKRKVSVGLSDYQKVEILEGLTTDETIYKP